ncbi:benzoylformate decarboxylase [Novosphingobium chloroacetimidivorans]|uniref:Benzoylformate decarboxylase n=1 Tax=Novosphingobium chloroacetimidivorans TaxID=1428314 RepID=A0A7W7KCI6_9SPHN|nr:benzoylformate decarboxylase [Novosphingobium chloroacetimidivorans]MBB4860320.1 benzoylformate decarboxylase [Novosphingobium chloroacetimidivorans]
MSVREATYAFLRSVGINKIFGNPGSTELAMFRDFPDDFEYVLGLHEGAVVAMADGYAVASDNATVVNLHSAAGVGNAMGSVFTAFRNQAPIIIIAGQQSRALLPVEPFLYSERATELPRPYVKWSIEPARAEDVPAAIARAYYIAMQEPRGPTFVSVPADDWDRPGEPVAPRQVSRLVRPDPAMIAELRTALAEASNPVFVVGQANANAGAWDETIALAELHQAPVYAGPHAARNSFPETHPLFAGHLLWDRAPLVKTLTGHDLIVVLGAPAFIYHVEGTGPFIPEGATLWQVIDDPSIASWSPVGNAIVGNMKLAINDLLDSAPLTSRTPPPPRVRLPAPAPDRLTDAYLMSRIEAICPDDRVIVCEAPSSLDVMRAHLPMKEPASYYAHASGGLGYGLASAIGIAMAEPRRRVIALIGDGSSMYAIQALWTAVKLGTPVVFVIVNNQAYQALVGFGRLLGMGVPVGTVIDGLDFVKLAEGMSMKGEAITEASALDAALHRAFAFAGPYLLEVRTQAA